MDRRPETFSNSLGAPLLGSKAVDLDAGRKEERMGADSTYRTPPLAGNPRSPHTAALDPSPSLRLSWKKGQRPRALESEISVKEEALSTAQDRASRPAGSQLRCTGGPSRNPVSQFRKRTTTCHVPPFISLKHS